MITTPTDVLVVGSGAAGLRAAIEARSNFCDVLVVSSSRIGLGNNSAIAGRGFAAVDIEADPQDSIEAHFKDTVIGGRFVNDQGLVDIITKSAIKQVYDLQRFGVEFRKRGEGFFVESVPGFSHPRIHMCQGSTLGINLTRPLAKYAENSGVKFMPGVFIYKLLKKKGGIRGAIGLDASGQTYYFPAKSMVLAAGGLGNIYLRNDNAKGTTGDGYALAYDCGVSLVDMEFIQFYPTSKGSGSALITYEPLLASGASFRNSLNQNVLVRYGIKDMLQITRDNLSRAIMREIIEGRDIDGSLMLDLTSLSESEFKRSIDSLHLPFAPKERTVPVAPTAHFCMGGIKIDHDCQTTVQGLFGAGEVCSGMHGANRLAGNALTGCFVLGTLAGAKASEHALQTSNAEISQKQLNEELQTLRKNIPVNGKRKISTLHKELQTSMWYNAGILRSVTGLKQALQVISNLKEQMQDVSVSSPSDLIDFLKMRNMLTVSEIVCTSALLRTESRGAHWRSDFPQEDNLRWLQNITISKGTGTMIHSFIPVNLQKLSP